MFLIDYKDMFLAGQLATLDAIDVLSEEFTSRQLARTLVSEWHKERGRQADPEPPTEPTPVSSDADWQCPTCRYSNGADWAFCRLCGCEKPGLFPDRPPVLSPAMRALHQLLYTIVQQIEKEEAKL